MSPVRLLGKDCIDCLVADREFVGEHGTGYLNASGIRYYLRNRQNFWLQKTGSCKCIKDSWLINDLKLGEQRFLHKLYLLKGEYVYLAGAKLKNSDGVPELQILICYNRPQEAKNKAKKEFKRRQQANLKRRKKGGKDPRGRKPARKNEAYKPERLDNGDTVVELLTRSRYLLMQPGCNWTESQKTRANLLFKLFPNIEQAYSLAHSLRVRYNNKTDDIIVAGESIREWCRMAKQSAIEDFHSVADTIEDRFTDVLRYFNNRSTNAFAESLNAKLKNFRAQVRGVIVKVFNVILQVLRIGRHICFRE